MNGWYHAKPGETNHGPWLIFNPTVDYIVAVDDCNIHMSTADEANRLYDLVNEIEDSPFGSMRIIPPNYQDEYAGFVKEKDRQPLKSILEGRNRVNPDYIEKRIERSWRDFKAQYKAPKPFIQRFAEFAESYKVWYDSDPIEGWKQLQQEKRQA